ncbi:Asp23/Gls24 family envelope stress response protein [bacterium]|nr:Asp23/Gls24 family envelope stress response protein [bacterium]
MNEQQEINPRDLGDIGVSNEVFESIALMCTKTINGVSGMETADGLVDSLSKVWGRSEAPSGVKVTTGEDDVVIDLSVVLEEGYPIPQVTEAIQREVKSQTEDMTGHAVKAVNILVADVKAKAAEAEIVSEEGLE